MSLVSRVKAWWKSTTPRDAENHFGTDETVREAHAVRSPETHRWKPSKEEPDYSATTLFGPRQHGCDTEDEVRA